MTADLIEIDWLAGKGQAPPNSSTITAWPLIIKVRSVRSMVRVMVLMR